MILSNCSDSTSFSSFYLRFIRVSCNAIIIKIILIDFVMLYDYSKMEKMKNCLCYYFYGYCYYYL